MTAEGTISGETPIAMIEGPKGTAEIFEYLAANMIEYEVKFANQSKTFNNLGEAYLEAEALTGHEDPARAQ